MSRFKIDLIVWKLYITEYILEKLGVFKIDLIVWKSLFVSLINIFHISLK